MKTELKLLFLILLVLCVRLSSAADLPAEYDLMVDYRKLYLQLQNGTEANMTDRMRLRRLERELRTAGLNEEEFAVLRKGKNPVLSEAGQSAAAEILAEIKAFDDTNSDYGSRSRFVGEILAKNTVYGLEHLAAFIPTIALSYQERFSLEGQIISILEGKKHPWSSVVRHQIIKQMPIIPEVADSGFFMHDYIFPLYYFGLNAKEETDFPAMIALLEQQAVSFNNMKQSGILIDALSTHPEYISRTLVETLYTEYQRLDSPHYLVRLLLLMRFLPAKVRATMVAGVLDNVNRGRADLEYFSHPVFNEDHFLDVVGNSSSRYLGGANLQSMNESIFTLPEFANRTDLGGLAPHIIVTPCENILAGDADEN